MSTVPELIVLPWGVYPRRVLIYLAEKGILSSPFIKVTPVHASPTGALVFADGKPVGSSVPILRIPSKANTTNTTTIKQSIAILDYFEDVCDSPDPNQPWQIGLAKSARGTMRGTSPEERARTRDILCLADEVTSHLAFACHKGSKLFSTMETQQPLGAQLALESCRRNLKQLDRYYKDDTRFEEDSNVGSQIHIADCVLYSTLHFAKDLYGVDLTTGPDVANIGRFYEGFGKRESVQVSSDHFPEMIKNLACQWLPLDESGG